MTATRDDDLGERLSPFDPPDHGPSFWPAVERRLGKEAGAPIDSPRGRWRFWLRPALATAVAVTACTVLVLVLAGVPGTVEVGPQPAGAVGRLLTAVDAGLARVRTLRGVMVTTDRNGRTCRTTFAVTAAGDAYVDQPIDRSGGWLSAVRRTYRQDLADMRAGRRPWDRRQLRSDRAVLARREWAGDATTKVSTSRAWYVDAFTGKPVGVGYERDTNSDGIFLGMPEPVGAEAANIWGLSSAVRVAIASAPDRVTLSNVSYEGRPATRAVIGVAGHRWVATIDRQYGLVLAFAPAQPATTASGKEPYAAFRITDVRVNETIDRSVFTVPPVFSLDAAFRRIPFGRHDARYFTDYDVGCITAPLDRVVRSAGVPILLPVHAPRGFRLRPQATEYRTSVTISYVRGLGIAQIRETDRENYPTTDRATWIDMSQGAASTTSGIVTETRGGALDGWPMRVTVPQLSDPRTADWWNAGVDGGADTPAVSLRGVLTRAEFLATVSSLRPYAGWSLWDRPAYQYARLLAAATIGIVVTAVAIEVVATARARSERRRRSGLRIAETLALGGCVALAVSLWLPWYRLESTGRHIDYALRGGSIRFVVAALACASGAALVALIRAGMGGWRLPAREPVLLAIFGLFALALLLDVRLVQPGPARFYVGDLAGGTAIWPTPWFGMLVGFVGVSLILLAALFSRRPERRDGTPG